MAAAIGVTPDRPILIDRFLRHALECEADAICDGTHAYVPAVMEHIELAGIHSGDSACVLPSISISDEHVALIKEYTRRIAEEMHVVGLMNIQYAIEDGKVFVIEANPRASRTVPLVSKVCGVQMVQIATDAIMGDITGRPSPVAGLKEASYAFYGVKEAVLPFSMFPEVDPILGPEMRSTGEVLGLAPTFGEAFYKSQEAIGSILPTNGTVFMSVSDANKDELEAIAREYVGAGLSIMATRGTAAFLAEHGIPCTVIFKQREGRPNITDAIANGQIDLVVNTPKGDTHSETDGSAIRRAAIRAHIPYVTTMAAAHASAVGIAAKAAGTDSGVNALQDIHAMIK
jgi:carbamoyl-phosphate synthase large subunit